MAEIVLQKVRTTQPQQAVSLRKDVARYFETCSSFINTLDAVNPSKSYVRNGTITSSQTKDAIGYKADGSSSYLNKVISIPSRNEQWIACQFRVDNNSAAGQSLYSISSSAASSGAVIRVNLNDSPLLPASIGVQRRGTDGSSVIMGQSANGAAAILQTTIGTVYTVVAVFPSLLVADAYVYINGVKYAVSGSDLTSATTQLVNESVGATVRGSIGNFSSNLVTFAASGRVIPERLAKQISENPWQIFVPEEQVITFDEVVTDGAIDLVGANSTQSNASSSGAITQTHVLSGGNSVQAIIIPDCTLWNNNTLVAENLISNSSISSPAIVQQHEIIVSNSISSSIISDATITQTHNLAIGNSQQSNITQDQAIIQIHQVDIGNSTESIVTESATISQQHLLQIDNLAQENLIQSASISTIEANNLIAQNVTQVNSLAAASISQQHLLDSNATQQQNIAPSISLISQLHILSPQSVTQKNGSPIAIQAQENKLLIRNNRQRHLINSFVI